MRNLLLKYYVTAQTILRDERGQDLIEYALVVAMIALAATAGMTSVAQNINAAFGTLGGRLSNCMAPGATTC